MRHSSLSTIPFLQKLYLRHFCTTNTLPCINNTIPLRYRSHAMKQAQEEVTDYLRSKTALPSIYAEKISKNSAYSIFEIISKLRYSPPDFRYTFRSFISDNPINEFGFFCESIGIDYLNIDKLLKHKLHFLEDDSTVFVAACCLAEFGFPWNKLGKLYVKNVLIFREKPEFLRRRLDKLISLGFDNQQIIGICLAFPGLLKEEEGGLDCDYDALLDDLKWVLLDFGFPFDKLDRLYVADDLILGKKLALRERLDRLASLGFGKQQIVAIVLAFPGLLKEEEEEGGLDCDYDALLDELKRVFLDLDLESCMVGNLDVWFEVCEKVKFFYELGVEKGEFGKLIVKGKSILTCYPMEALGEKVEFLSRFGFEKSEVGVLILSNPKVLGMKIDGVISVSSILEHFGLCKEKMISVEQKYKHVFGRNKMVNLPNILRAMDLNEWFIDRMKSGYCELFASYDLSSPDDGLDEDYVRSLEKLKTMKKPSYSFSKLEFLHSMGFGESSSTIKVLNSAHVSPSDLQERFDFLLSEGMEFSKVCRLLIRVPKMLNQEIDTLKKKMDFLVQEIGLPLDHLVTFPAYLLYNLEKHIKPRYKFHVLLTKKGWIKQQFTLSSIIATGQKGFLTQLSRIHPKAPELWMKQYEKKNVKNVDGCVLEKQT